MTVNLEAAVGLVAEVPRPRGEVVRLGIVRGCHDLRVRQSHVVVALGDGGILNHHGGLVTSERRGAARNDRPSRGRKGRGAVQ
uniref:Uncharacterized protein n=1 Tax=Zea mays TaxID=4577 RepID=C4J7X4_MAIZE|nr:unknown [Zea mays]